MYPGTKDILVNHCIRTPHDRSLIKDLLNHNGEWYEWYQHYIYSFLEPSICQDMLNEHYIILVEPKKLSRTPSNSGSLSSISLKNYQEIVLKFLGINFYGQSKFL